jgi:hypothetical protein
MSYLLGDFEIFRVLHHVMMKQDTTRALQQSHIILTTKTCLLQFLTFIQEKDNTFTNPDKVQMEITLIQTYETMQTTTQHRN